MGRRAAAEHVVPSAAGGPQLRLRVDLHGVSVFGPGQERTLIRWEWVQSITAEDGVEVRSAKAAVHLPRGAFGLPPDALCSLLEAGRAIERRSDVITELATGEPDRG